MARKQEGFKRRLLTLLIGVSAFVTSLVTGPISQASAASYEVRVQFNVGVANIVVELCFGSAVTFTNPSPTSGTNIVTQTVTGSAPCTGTRVTENAVSGYYLPTNADYDSYICNSPCAPTTPSSRPSGSTQNIWSMMKTSHIPFGGGNYYWISFSPGTLAAAPPSVSSAAAINDLTPLAGESLTGSASFSGSPTPTVAHQWYRCTQSSSTVGTSIPADCSAISGATNTTYTATSSDVGRYVRYSAVATNASGTATSISKAETAVGTSSPGTPDLDAASDRGSSSTDNATSDNTPSITTGSLLVGATVTLTATRTGGGSSTCTFVATTTSESCTFSNLADGTWSVVATQTIGSTTSAASAALSMTIDTAGPTAPSQPDLAVSSDSGSSNSDDITNDSTPTITVTGISGTGTVTATKSGSSPVSCTVSAGSCTLGTLADGVWSISVTDTDAAGNTSSPSSALNVTVDTTGPTVVLSSSPNAGSHTSTTSFAFTATFSEDVTGFSSTSDVSIGGTSSTWTKGSSSGSGSVYTFNVSSGSPSSGTLTVDVAAGAATDTAGNSSTASSTWTSSLVTAPPTNTVPPTVSGTASIGSTLTAGTGSWDDKGDASPTTAYQWQYSSDGGSTWTDIAGATNATYVIGDAYGDDRIRVATIRTNAAGSSSRAVSSGTSAVAYPSATNSVAPTISGTVATGSTLTASTGTWSGSALTYAYQWQSSTDGGSTWNSISGATSATYVVQSSDLSSTIRVRVTATNGNASPVTESSVGTPSANSLTVTPTDGGASVAFTASAPNGSSITGYRLAVQPVGGGATTTVSCTTSSPCLVTGLLGGTQYAFSIRPLTSTVVGPLSTSVTATPTAAAPNPPTITSVVDGAAVGSATLQIVQGEMNGSVLTRYIITVTDTAASSTTTSYCAGSPCNVSGLTPGRTYSFVAVADTSAGQSTSSNSVTLAVRSFVATPAPEESKPVIVEDSIGDPNEDPVVDPVVNTSPMLAPPLIVPAVSIELAGEAMIRVSATFESPVIADLVTTVTFLVLNENGKQISTMTVEIEVGLTAASVIMPKLPEGAQVLAYTSNKAGVSPNAPAGTNILNRPTSSGRDASGRVVLIGKRIADSIIFDPASPRLDKIDFKILDKVAVYVANNGGTVLISGFARRNGVDSLEYLKKLSLSRAENVAKYLSERGVRVWIRFEGYGPVTQAIGNPTDRKVEVRWTSEPPLI